jgi:hypothetical protein
LQDLKTEFTTSDSGVYKKIDELDKRLNLMEGYGRVHELRERIKQTSNFIERIVLQRRLFEEDGKFLSEIGKAVKTKPSIQKIIKFEEKNIDVDYLVDLKIDISENDFLITFCLSKNKESNEIRKRLLIFNLRVALWEYFGTSRETSGRQGHI